MKLHPRLNCVGADLQRRDGARRVAAVLDQVDRLGESRRIGHFECTDAARRAFQRMGDFFPGFYVPGIENGLQAVDELAGLRIEKPQNLGIDGFVTSRIAGKVSKVDGTVPGGHARIPVVAL